jgi:hypothetical protein
VILSYTRRIVKFCFYLLIRIPIISNAFHQNSGSSHKRDTHAVRYWTAVALGNRRINPAFRHLKQLCPCAFVTARLCNVADLNMTKHIGKSEIVNR